MREILSLDLALKSLLILVIASGGARFVLRPHTGASARHLVWRCALAALLALPLASLSPFAGTVSLPTAALPRDTVAPGPAVPNPVPTAIPLASAESAPVPAADSAAPAPPPSQTAVVRGFLRSRWNPIITLRFLWLSGTVLLIARLLASLIAVGRRSRRDFAPASGNGEVAAAAASARSAVGITCPVTVRIARNATPLPPVPLLLGIRRPVILLPAAAASWNTDRLEAVLRHEMAHIRRGDWAWQFLSEVVVALYWWNPLVWRAARQLRAESEECCDDLVIASGVRPSDYAAHLIGIAGTLRSQPRGIRTPVTVAMAEQPEISRRVEAALRENKNRRAPGRVAVSVGAVAAVALLLPLIALRLGNHPVEAVAAAVGRVTSDHRALFAGGGVVEVVAVAHQGREGSEPGWWAADGSRLAGTPPLPTEVLRDASDPWHGSRGRTVKLKLSGIPEDAHAYFRAQDVFGLPYERTSRSRTYRVQTASVGAKTTTSLIIGLATGPWRTVHQWSPSEPPPLKSLRLLAMTGISPEDRPEGVDSWGRTRSPEPFNLRYGKPQQTGRDLLLPLMSNGPKLNWRAAAILKNGNYVTSGDINASRSGDEGNPQPAVIAGKVLFPNVRLAEVARFEFQVRPYRFVMLRNIALYPDQSTAESWQTLSTWKPSAFPATLTGEIQTATGTKRLRFVRDTAVEIRFSRSDPPLRSPVISMGGANAWATGYEWRVVAVTKKGRAVLEHSPKDREARRGLRFQDAVVQGVGYTGKAQQMELTAGAYFEGIRLRDIARFEFQARPRPTIRPVAGGKTTIRRTG
ncbi:MAG: M56 family metallopeptidase [Cytophagales bacterium]|nr:M56 family metallopeptidase [Armatimonadota bacterium]